MSRNTFGLIACVEVIIGLIAILILFTANRKHLKSTNHTTTAPRSIAEMWRK